jgi:glycosyltransferase involved in cell wall biosynthesis
MGVAMTSEVRIALISTPFVPVPPPSYGGTELIVAHLARELSARGHEVVLYTTGDSTMPGVEIRSLYAQAVWPPDSWHELDHTAFAVRNLQGEHFDIVHAHCAPILAFAPLVRAPIVYTLHHVREEHLHTFYAGNAHRNVRFIAISERQRELFLPEVDAEVIHHGLDSGSYGTGPGGDYAAFLGRFAEEKGPAVALDVAQMAGVPIRLAGKPHWKDMPYFHEEVEPRLARRDVDWVGEASLKPKCKLLGGACATLFPINWEEPFGLVMIESMLCGTPVLAFPRGSAPELIDEGLTGFLCRDEQEMAARLRALRHGEIAFDREACRARAAERFSIGRMTDRYLEVYGRMAERPALASVPANA